MKNYTHKSTYFYGNKISDYGLKNGYVDYKTLAQCGDMVLCNDITKLFYSSINSEYVEPQQVNGFIDNQDEIDELQERIDELQNSMFNYQDDIENLQNELKNVAPLSYFESSIKADIDDLQDNVNELQEQIDDLQEQIDDLQAEQDNQKEIFQYYIISDNLARILQELTNEIIYYIESLDIYVWGITHYGTSWDYVLTDIKIELDGVENE